MQKTAKAFCARVHQTWPAVAKNTNRLFNEVLQKFEMERFRNRLSFPDMETLVLKGALHFCAWEQLDCRAIRDIDQRASADTGGYGPVRRLLVLAHIDHDQESKQISVFM